MRRSLALGIIADPARGLRLFSPGDADDGPTTRRKLTAELQLTEANLLGLDPVLTDADQRSHLDQVVRAWAGRHDLALTIKTVRHCGGAAGGCTDCPAEIDCTDHPDSMKITYAPSARAKQDHPAPRPHLRPPQLQPARPARCDCDHIKPFDPDDPDAGPTCPVCNLAPLG